MAPKKQTRKAAAPTNETGESIEPEATAMAATASTSKSGGDEDAIYFWQNSDLEHGYLCQWHHGPFPDAKDPSKIYPTAEQQVPSLLKLPCLLLLLHANPQPPAT